MALTINTNLSSLIVQRNLNDATNLLNQSIERMTTGYKINHAGDNAAGYSIATNWTTQLGSLDIAADNAATGADMLTTLEDTYALVTSHLQRVRDLTEQAANGTYGSDSLKAIQAEITARLEEIDRIAENAEFNGLQLMNGSIDDVINLQVGLYASESSQISLIDSLFQDAHVSALFTNFGGTADATVSEVAKLCSGYDSDAGQIIGGQADMLDKIDTVINEISSRTTTLGAAQNRIDSAIETIDVQTENITSSLSTIRDADVAEESSEFIRAQILQQASATLLATANQTPSIALSLV